MLRRLIFIVAEHYMAICTMRTAVVRTVQAFRPFVGCVSSLACTVSHVRRANRLSLFTAARINSAGSPSSRHPGPQTASRRFQFTAESHIIPVVSKTDVAATIKNGQHQGKPAVLIDVRNVPELAHGTIPSALVIPRKCFQLSMDLTSKGRLMVVMPLHS